MKYYKVHLLLTIPVMIGLFMTQSQTGILIGVGLMGYAISSIFPIIYSKAIQARPEKANELSGLMITGVFGGAVVPPIMGAMANVLGNQSGSLMVISAAVLYLIVLGFGIRQTSK